MKQEDAIQRLERLAGRDLHDIAREMGVPIVAESGAWDKGWAGNVLERYLGKAQDNAQAPDFGDWELKSIPLKRVANGLLTFKETMAITNINAAHVMATPFRDSHLLAKLQRFICVARMVGDEYTDPSHIYAIARFDLQGDLYAQVEQDYEAVRDVIRTHGLQALNGHIGVLVQPRPKGGKDATTKAFYARKELLAKIINVSEWYGDEDDYEYA